MELCAACIRCVMDRQEERVSGLGTQRQRSDFLRGVARVIADADPEDAAPVLVERIHHVYEEIFGPAADYGEVKREFNELMLSLEPQIRRAMEKDGDALHAAMLFSRAANYIDFGMAGRVEKETLFSLLEQAACDSLDEEVYAAFLADLEKARRLVYVTDNCGEILCDRLAAEEMARRFPKLEITVMVRGRDALNDATWEDAVMVGMDRVARVVGNGCGVAGTPLSHIGEQARELLQQADVILAKGQGNYETMHGCGLNVYYLFLCKCDWFCGQFGVKRNTGMFVREG